GLDDISENHRTVTQGAAILLFIALFTTYPVDTLLAQPIHHGIRPDIELCLYRWTQVSPLEGAGGGVDPPRRVGRHLGRCIGFNRTDGAVEINADLEQTSGPVLTVELGLIQHGVRVEAGR